jgi:hypothetical protein
MLKSALFEKFRVDADVTVELSEGVRHNPWFFEVAGVDTEDGIRQCDELADRIYEGGRWIVVEAVDHYEDETMCSMGMCDNEAEHEHERPSGPSYHSCGVHHDTICIWTRSEWDESEADSRAARHYDHQPMGEE